MLPKVLVLLASYNGLPWIEAQIDSIIQQNGVDISILISDDMSSDGTKEFLENLTKAHRNIALLPTNIRLGSAGKNFFHLIKNACIDEFDYIAFSDQDDVWIQDKVIKNISLLTSVGSDGVSSNVVAFWQNGEQKLIVKSQLQREWDYLFESAGPGCTFLMTPWLVNKVKEQLVTAESLARHVVLHDWLVYAVCRVHGRKWVIDSEPSVLYRQHGHNVLGANRGLKAVFTRLKKIRDGWYRAEISKLAQVCMTVKQDPSIRAIAKLALDKSLLGRIKFLRFIPQARRKFSDRIALLFAILFF